MNTAAPSSQRQSPPGATGGPGIRMMLGTAQFGQAYGVANRQGRPDEETARRMVEAAWEGGVRAFDTARAYGDSEQVLGRALAGLGIQKEAMVSTKIRPLSEDQRGSDAAAAAVIEEDVTLSQRCLGLECLPLVLFHRESDASRFLPLLDRLRQAGRIKRIGSSCEHAPGTARDLLGHPQVSALQVAASVLDTRHRRSGLFEAAAEAGVDLYVRSVFLQGLVLMPEMQVPASLRAVLPVRRMLLALAAESGITLAELCVRYLLGLPGVTALVVGAEGVEQVLANVELVRRGALPADLQREVERRLPSLGEDLITPSRWELTK